MKTLVLKKGDMAELLSMGEVMNAVEQAFRDYASGQAQMPAKVYIQLERGDFRAMPSALPGAAGLKWVNVHPGNPAQGLLTVMAKILLNDPDTGLEFADLDGTHVTDFRTGAAGGLAVKYLAKPSASRLGLIGASFTSLHTYRLLELTDQVDAALVLGGMADAFAFRHDVEMGTAHTRPPFDQILMALGLPNTSPELYFKYYGTITTILPRPAYSVRRPPSALTLLPMSLAHLACL